MARSCSRRCRCGASRPSCRRSWRPSATEVERALEYVELYGLYTECEAVYQVDQPDGDVGRPRRRRPGGVRVRPADGRLADVHQHDPPALDRPARPRQDGAGQDDDRPRRPAAQAGPRPVPPRRRVRPREHADRQQRRRELLVAGDAPPRPRRAPALRVAHARRGAGPAEARPRRPRRLPAPLLPALRGRPDGADRDRRRRAADEPHPHEGVPGRLAPGARAPRPRPPHDPHHRRARLRRRGAAAAVRRDRRRRR